MLYPPHSMVQLIVLGCIKWLVDWPDYYFSAESVQATEILAVLLSSMTYPNHIIRINTNSLSKTPLVGNNSCDSGLWESL
jgi:hypothetical protein